MADWYVSSAAWTAIPQFAVSGVYTLGQFVRPLTAPAFSAQCAWRCTTAGTASTEPNWAANTNDGATLTTGGATFTNVTGRSAYGWSAAAGNFYTLASQAPSPRFVAGDRVFLSSDHSETNSVSSNYAPTTTASFGLVQIISVNRAGSVPPVAADAASGASIAYTGGGVLLIDVYSNCYWQGITFTAGGTSANIQLQSSGSKSHYFKNCAFVLSTSNTTAYIGTSGNGCQVTFDNTTVQFSNAGHRILGGGQSLDFRWINTPSATSGTVPTYMFTGGTGGAALVLCRGVDLSAITTTLYYANNTTQFGKVLFDSCRIASSVVRLGIAAYNLSADEVELVNCYDGTSFLAERHTPAGDVTTELSTTLAGGAQDNVGLFSHKMVSSSRANTYVMPLEGFWLDANYATTGSAKTATVEIVSSASLNNNDITLLVEYEGTIGSSLASFVTSLASPLTAAAAVPTSSATWNSLPATPARQHLQVTFTPQTAGRVRAQVRLGKPSATVYVNPQVIIT